MQEFKQAGPALQRLLARRAQKDTNGSPDAQAKPDPEPTCPNCLDTGWVGRDVPVGDPGFGRGAPCACGILERRRVSFILGLSDLPEDMTFASWKHHRELLRPAFDEAVATAEDEKRWRVLTLVGGFGTGKTHLLAAMTRRLAERGVLAKMRYVPLLRQEILDSYQEGHTRDLVDFYARFGVLLLDDLGAGRVTPTESTVEHLETIINARWQSGPLLVVSTNMDDGETRKRFGPRIADRLFDMMTGRVKVVILNTDSYRTGEQYD